jgi:hypothetical protein
MERKKRTLSSKVGVSEERLSRKIAIVRREHPDWTMRHVAGAAAGILKDRKKHGR